jgi:hypothetical protein
MSKPTREENIEANRVAPTPPCFGEGKPWKFRTVEWLTGPKGEGSATVMIPNGMEVADHMRAFYWKERETFGDMIVEAAKVGATLSVFAIRDPDTMKLVGASCLQPDDGAHEIAWLSCMFGEMGLGSIAFELPPNIDLTAIRGGRRVAVRDTESGGAQC